MTNNQLTPERISDISDYFVEMQDHYSDPADRENFEIFRDAELLMKELQERRKAERGSEPVAIVEPSDYVTAAQLVGEGPVRKAVHELYEGALRIGDKLYRHAQPALVPDKMIYQDGVLFVLNNDMSSIERGTVAMRAWNACRAAMLQELQKSAGDAGDAGGVQISRGCRSNENMRDMRAGNSPVIPDGSAVAALTGIPMIPDGYVMVPKEPTEAMINAWLSEVANWRGHVAGYKAMLAAAPQEVNGE